MKLNLRPLSGKNNTQAMRLILSLLCLQSGSSNADDAKPPFLDFTLHGLLDFRAQYRDAQPGQLENGLGKFRSGGGGIRLLANEAALILQTRMRWDWAGTLTLKYADHQYTPLDLSEAFLTYRPVSTTAWQFSARFGMFFPPISLENSGTAWSSPYTLTSSAINTWVGQELRTFGGEAQISYKADTGDRFKLFAAGLANNDTAGALLAWRGWSLQDYEATLLDKFPLPNAIGIQAQFPLQANLLSKWMVVLGITQDYRSNGPKRMYFESYITITVANPPPLKTANMHGEPTSGVWESRLTCPGT